MYKSIYTALGTLPPFYSGNSNLDIYQAKIPFTNLRSLLYPCLPRQRPSHHFPLEGVLIHPSFNSFDCCGQFIQGSVSTRRLTQVSMHAIIFFLTRGILKRVKSTACPLKKLLLQDLVAPRFWRLSTMNGRCFVIFSLLVTG